MEKKYTIGQAADYLNKSVNTLQRLDRERKLIAKRTDTNRRFYTKDQLDRYKRIREDTRIYSGGESYFLFTFI